MQSSLPNSPDESAVDRGVERAVLGALLGCDAEVWQPHEERLHLDLFAVPAHRALADVVLRRLRDGRPVDAVLAFSDLAESGDRRVPRELPFKLVSESSFTYNFAHWVTRLEEMKARRAEGRAHELSSKALRTYLPAALSSLEHGIPRVSTGWERLDAALGGGFVVPSLNIVGAKPKIGKSTWAQIVAERHVASRGFVYYLDLENGPDRFLRRLMCRRAQVGPDEVAGDRFKTETRAERWRDVVSDVRDGGLGQRLFLDTERRLSPQDFEDRIALCRDVAGDAPLLVVVDSLQKLPMRDLSERRAAIDAWLRDLERLRDAYRLAIVLISELKRPAQGKQYDANETAFKESGDIEYTGDLLLTLDRPATESDATAAGGSEDELRAPATLRIVFNRDGRDGQVAEYRSVFPYYGMEELAPSVPPPAPPNGASARTSTPARGAGLDAAR